jgi:hypothetical protein
MERVHVPVVLKSGDTELLADALRQAVAAARA